MNKCKLVPMEPTEAMIDAARDQHEGEPYLPVSLYKAMLAAAPDVKGEPVVPEGFRLIAVNETFDSLTFWLDRCEQKGHLENCADLVEPWESFEYREVEAPQPEPDVSELVEALLWYSEQVLGCRKITSEGVQYRAALDRDGGARARAAIADYHKGAQP